MPILKRKAISICHTEKFYLMKHAYHNTKM